MLVLVTSSIQYQEACWSPSRRASRYSTSAKVPSTTASLSLSRTVEPLPGPSSGRRATPSVLVDAKVDVGETGLCRRSPDGAADSARRPRGGAARHGAAPLPSRLRCVSLPRGAEINGLEVLVRPAMPGVPELWPSMSRCPARPHPGAASTANAAGRTDGAANVRGSGDAPTGVGDRPGHATAADRPARTRAAHRLSGLPRSYGSAPGTMVPAT